jgi:hypothetical protein
LRRACGFQRSRVEGGFDGAVQRADSIQRHIHVTVFGSTSVLTTTSVFG